MTVDSAPVAGPMQAPVSEYTAARSAVLLVRLSRNTSAPIVVAAVKRAAASSIDVGVTTTASMLNRATATAPPSCTRRRSHWSTSSDGAWMTVADIHDAKPCTRSPTRAQQDDRDVYRHGIRLAAHVLVLAHLGPEFGQLRQDMHRRTR